MQLDIQGEKGLLKIGKLADEPTGNLDGQNSNIIFDLLVRLNQVKKITCLFVTHNTKYSKLANKQYSLQKGKINILN